MDRSRLAVAAAVPSAVGYTVPLVVGLATGHVAEGVAASAGALIVGFANLGGRYRLRSATLLAATLASGIAALLGGLAGPNTVATVALIGVWGFAGGLLVSFGTRAAFVGMLSTWTLLLASDLNLHGEAVVQRGVADHGGRTGANARRDCRVAVAPVCRRAPRSGGRLPCLGSLCARAGHGHAAEYRRRARVGRETVGAGTLRGEPGALRALVEQGEWIRLHLAALARSHVPAVNDTMAAAATALETIADGSDPSPFLTCLERGAQVIDKPVARRQAASLDHVDRGRWPRESRRRARARRRACVPTRVAVRAHVALQHVPPRSAAVGCAGRCWDRVPRSAARLGLLGAAYRPVRAQA